jgi:RNA polymerase sigma-70 factor (ECF subfamily)
LAVGATPSIHVTRTTTQLLDALHDSANEPVWLQIDARYRPVVTAMARRLGLTDSDSDEVAQQTLAEFVKAYGEGRYDRSKGRLSSWILGIAHHSIIRVLKRSKRENATTTSLGEVVDEPALRSIWADERDRAILSQALEVLRGESGVDDRTLLAFELTSLRGVPAPEAAEQCGMSVDQVYVAKSRIVKRLKALVEQLTEAFEADE